MYHEHREPTDRTHWKPRRETALRESQEGTDPSGSPTHYQTLQAIDRMQDALLSHERW